MGEENENKEKKNKLFERTERTAMIVLAVGENEQ